MGCLLPVGIGCELKVVFFSNSWKTCLRIKNTRAIKTVVGVRGRTRFNNVIVVPESGGVLIERRCATLSQMANRLKKA